LSAKKAKYVQTQWNIEGSLIPVKLFLEWRTNRRVSIAKDAVIVRMPLLGSGINKVQHEAWAKNWLKVQKNKKASVFDHLLPKRYFDGQEIRTTAKPYILRLQIESRKTASAKCANNYIICKFPERLTQSESSAITHKLIGRVLARDNLKWVEEKVYWFNDRYFNRPIQSVRMKNNKSNWGSCSSSGNINLSVRLLFAPEDVQDYVIVHELAHLIEMNHTDRFWALVQEVMPDYKKKERWLKKNSHLCNF
jgi:predicted metal-dependent hydrolase